MQVTSLPVNLHLRRHVNFAQRVLRFCILPQDIKKYKQVDPVTEVGGNVGVMLRGSYLIIRNLVRTHRHKVRSYKPVVATLSLICRSRVLSCRLTQFTYAPTPSSPIADDV